MGMTIDEAISWIITISEHEGEDIPIYDTDVESIKTAVSIMRKYQKIVQIMERTVDDGTSMYDTLQEIEEVVEDGDVD